MVQSRDVEFITDKDLPSGIKLKNQEEVESFAKNYGIEGGKEGVYLPLSKDELDKMEQTYQREAAKPVKQQK